MRAVVLFRGFAFGGIERYVLAIVQGLARRGVPWEIWHPKPEFVHELLAKVPGLTDTGRVMETDVTHGGRSFARHVVTAYRRFREIDEPFSVFCNESCPGAFAAAALAARLARAHRVVNVTHWISDTHVRQWSGGSIGLWKWRPFLLTRLVGAVASTSVAPSRVATRMLNEVFHVAPTRTKQIPHGVPIPADHDAKPSHTPSLLYLGRLSYEKGPDVLLRALVLLPTDLDYTLNVAGDGPLLDDLRQQADALGLAQRVRWLGFCDQPEKLLAQADICVVPSRTECFPMTVLEAMAAGVPCVATRTGGMTEMIDHGVTGLLAKPDDAPSLAAAIETVLTDPDLRRAMGQAARRTAETRYAQHRMVNDTVELLI